MNLLVNLNLIDIVIISILLILCLIDFINKVIDITVVVNKQQENQLLAKKNIVKINLIKRK